MSNIRSYKPIKPCYKILFAAYVEVVPISWEIKGQSAGWILGGKGSELGSLVLRREGLLCIPVTRDRIYLYVKLFLVVSDLSLTHRSA